ncbi:MAG: copper chaperone [Jatrophihabitans sp.]|nr:MAG: copper chaperone [Jatrophihabitans sp.]
MTCEHCVHAVTTEVSRVAGVTGVDVDLDSGQLAVRGEDFTDEQITAAVDEAGYQLT